MTPTTIGELRAILDGLEGVTPGPWQTFGNSITDFGREWQGSMSMEFIPNGTDEDGVNERHEKDAAHIARLDPETVRSIVTELLSRRSDGLGTVSVKPLEWETHDDPSEGRTHYGYGVFGHWYGVSRKKAGVWGIVHHVRGKPVQLPLCSSRGEAMAAAQSDFETRVRSCLTSIGVEALPKLENCGRYLAEDNTGQWHYINHAGTWQGCPRPFPASPPEQELTAKVERLEADLAEARSAHDADAKAFLAAIARAEAAEQERDDCIDAAKASWAKHGGMEIAKGQWEARAIASEAKTAALVDALTPSGDTKADYIGEFQFNFTVWDPDGEDEITHIVKVPWTTTKEIMSAIRARAALGVSP